MKKIFEPDTINLDTLFYNNFTIPVYQRPYSWGKEQIDDLYNDLISNYDSHEENTYQGLYTGTIYLKYKNTEGKHSRYYVIDGQQRITTFTLILLSIYWIAKDRKLDFNIRTLSQLKGSLWRYSNSEKDYQKENRLLELGNLDRDMLIKVFDSAFDNNLTFSKFILRTKIDKIECEKLILENLKFFYENISKKFIDSEEGNDALIDFYDYLNNATQFIVIYVHFSENRIFEIFESINSKGKQLDQIDLIKSYIFQLLSAEDYIEYSTLWGELIKKTNDSLEKYLEAYIRAYIKFYTNALNVKNFKSLCKTELKSYFNVETSTDAVKVLIKDLNEKVNFFQMMKTPELLPKTLKQNNEFMFYYNSINWLDYKHPIPLLFKSLCLFDENIISKQNVISLYKNSLSFMLSFQTINARDSKDAISVFSTILNTDYRQNKLDSKKVSNEFKKKLSNEDITLDNMNNKLKQHKGYDNTDKRETIVLLSYFESIEDGKINYNNANIIMQNRSMFAIDHILPQNPKPEDVHFFYYGDYSNDKEGSLVLKDNHDFPAFVNTGMEYNEFKNKVLHKLGNLRIIQAHENIEKKNCVANIGDYGNFNSYSQIEDRANKLAELLYNSDLLAINND
jgi:uncharacterized protein with ParB-like and HNH nuclease domain